MAEGTLYSYSISGVNLLKAIDNYKEYLQDAIALLYSPESCYFAKFEPSGDLTKWNQENSNQELELDYLNSYIFEARIFNETHELRWLNQKEGKGTAVLISEQKLAKLGDIDENFMTYLEKIPDEKYRQYLLWGERTETRLSNGWLRLSTARIGSLDIPLGNSLRENQRVYLNTVEYLGEVDDFGNVSVIEERLVNLEAK